MGFDIIKNSLTTISGWVAAIQMIVKGIEYFVPASEDAMIQAVTDPLCALIIAGGALYHFYKAGKDATPALATPAKS